MGLAGSQDPVCLQQGLEPGGQFSLQGLAAQPSCREHVNTSRAGQQAGREKGTEGPWLLSLLGHGVQAPRGLLWTPSWVIKVATSSHRSWARVRAMPSPADLLSAWSGDPEKGCPSWEPWRTG